MSDAKIEYNMTPRETTAREVIAYKFSGKRAGQIGEGEKPALLRSVCAE